MKQTFGGCASFRMIQRPSVNCQGLGKVVLAVSANAIRLLMAVAGGHVAIDAIGVGPSAVFVAITAAFVAYATLTSAACLRISAQRHKDDDATRGSP